MLSKSPILLQGDGVERAGVRRLGTFQKRFTKSPAARRGLTLTHPPGASDRSASREVAVPEAVVSALSGLTSGVWDWEAIEEFTTRTVAQLLDRRGTPSNLLTPPRMDIAIPAIEAMRYSPLKTQLAALVATSMDTRRADLVHPSFIEMLKQLTLDEINLIASMPAPGMVVPVADISFVDSYQHVYAGHRNVMPPIFAALCRHRAAISNYVDNLARLRLVSSPPELRIDDDRHYQLLLEQDFVRRLMADKPNRLKTRVDRKLISITDLGETFRQVCASDETLRLNHGG